MSVTVKDLARVAGVSTATVSRALRGFESVNPETRHLIQEVADRLGYVGTPAAATLSTGRSGSIGIITPHVDRVAFSRMLTGVVDTMRGAGIDVVLYATGDPSDPHPRPPYKRLARRVDGFLVMSVAAESPDVEEILELRMPSVMFGTHAQWTSSVRIDDRASAATAVRHLLDLEHRRIGLIYGRERENPLALENQRFLGFLDAMSTAGIEPEPRLELPGMFTMQGGQEAMKGLLDQPEPPTAVFAFSDEMAAGAIYELRQRGLRPGADVAVIGFDGHDVATLLDLTTIKAPYETIGSTAASLLLGQLEQPTKSPEAVVLPTELIVRSSTNSPER